MTNCIACGKEIGRKSKKYCSYKCYFNNMNHQGINNSRYGIKMSEDIKRKIGLGNMGKLLGRPSPLRGRLHTPEHNKKISESTSKALLQPGMREKLATNLGKITPQDVKLKLSISNRGQKRSEDARKNMRIGIAIANHPSSFKGRTHTEESNNKNRAHAIQRLVTHKYKDTKPELMLKGMLIDSGFVEGTDFVHQKHISDIKHSYVADFYFPEYKAVIEEDGTYFHKGERALLDQQRTNEMTAKGYSVLRLTDREILKNYTPTKHKALGFIFDSTIKNIRG